MPLGGAQITWTEGTPAETDVVDAAPLRSILTSIRNAMGSEHFWPATGGASVGYHLPGSGRAFVDVQSNVSSSGTEGRVMFTSDTSRLFHVGSAGTVLLGGLTSLLMGANAILGSLPQRSYWAVEVGQANLGAGGSVTVTIPNSGYSGVPFVFLTRADPAGQSSRGATMLASGPSATQFTVNMFDTTGNLLSGALLGFYWMSVGTRTL